MCISRILVAMALCGCAQVPTKAGSDSPIYVFGSIHGNMLHQPRNSISDFMKVIYSYRPTVVLTEVRAESGVLEAIKDGAVEQSLVYAFANERHLKVISVDSSGTEDNVPRSVMKKVKPLFLKFRHVVENGSIGDSQSVETQELIRARYGVLERFGFHSLQDRDEKICQNIRTHLPELVGEKVLVVFGLAHKHSLEDCFRKTGRTPLNFNDWFDAKAVNHAPISNEFKEAAISMLRDSKGEPKEIDSWIQAVQSL